MGLFLVLGLNVKEAARFLLAASPYRCEALRQRRSG